jgi:hypothetical protein
MSASLPEPDYSVRSRDSGLDGQTTLGLLKRLMSDLSVLFQQEMALATAEVTGALGKLSAALLAMLGGGAILFAGFLTLLAAAVLGLALVVAPWLAALIVGGAVTIVGLTVLIVGKKGVDPETLKPRRSADSLRKDKEVLSRSAP